ncbi:MAG TPA: rhodanese-like domain-containing protein [Gaiellaceae bacterium]|jgi:rhodanese-related sulfurtransferase|nr:rhodanese-like domain-containing protein [Gaiellaceae bacterium]
MPASLAEITRESLWRRLQLDEELVLVDALSPMSYARSHLPGAISIPPQWGEEWVRRRIPDRDTEIVVYCANSTCDSSVIVARQLADLGYRNIKHYAGGKEDWTEAGLPLEGGAA